MGIMDELKRLAHPYEDEEDDDFEEYEPVERVAAERRRERTSSRSVDDSGYSVTPGRSNNKVVNIHTTTQLQVVLVKAEMYEDVSEIADHLREKRTVLLNLETTKADIAQRILDFLSGVTYAQEGKIKKVAADTWIITPYTVSLLGDLIDELENNGIYF